MNPSVFYLLLGNAPPGRRAAPVPPAGEPTKGAAGPHERDTTDATTRPTRPVPDKAP